MAAFAESRATLLEERDKARKDTRLKARFLSYRMNCPTADELSVLLTVEKWRDVLARAVPERRGRPVVGVDCGAGRAWSAGTALWRNGRCEAVAVAPGTPGYRGSREARPGRARHLSALGGVGCLDDGRGSACAACECAGRARLVVAAVGDRVRPVPARGAARRGAGAGVSRAAHAALV